VEQIRYQLSLTGTKAAPAAGQGGVLEDLYARTKRINAFVGENVVLVGSQWDNNGNILEGVVRLYDSPANALADDGVTGLIASYPVRNTMIGKNLAKAITRRG